MRKANQARPDCADCLDAGETCDRHAGRCIGCGSVNVSHPDVHAYRDGVRAWWCRECDGEWRREEQAEIRAELRRG